MASATTMSIHVIFLAVVLAAASVQGQGDDDALLPSSPAPAPSGVNGRRGCPSDVAEFGACVNLGQDPAAADRERCCGRIRGLSSREAYYCLCAAFWRSGVAGDRANPDVRARVAGNVNAALLGCGKDRVDDLDCLVIG
ncbi:putative lipid-binding protein At4g00165 [Brachypodium distachyon]|uniref:Hydrophobic seed protein domain-containing protein n=1 Tax=Brachypodium distachyon TaxID=15368 RepID=I1HH62_BRADI|nr:putative lipid-binding protein At4g00165 [Brachypodium distachyon]KQK05190.1 hypothetical protein BRADI_2g18590v3 [Brachypodium distachyon]|eukprot:XP_010233149.1 putative lipid-binding protein At4g00165 [Brachypodium distachyon]